MVGWKVLNYSSLIYKCWIQVNGWFEGSQVPLIWVVEVSALAKRGKNLWLLSESEVCIWLLQPWLGCWALATQGNHQPITPVCPASQISGQRAGKSHHWEENNKKVWSTCSVTPWGPGAPHPQKSALTASLPLCHSTLLRELCGCRMCVKRNDNSCCCY